MNNKIIEKKKIFIIGGLALLVILLIIIKTIDNNYEKNRKEEVEYSVEITNSIEELEDKIIVYITGEVNKEGVIELKEGSRIADAIDKAGGITEKANLKNVNLAYELEDGQKIYIPNMEETSNIDITEGIVTDSIENKKININKATINELQTLTGIGESLAQSIIKYREENGTFKKVEELMNVPGIGESKFETIKDNIEVK